MKRKKFYCPCCQRRLWRVGGYKFYQGQSKRGEAVTLISKKDNLLTHSTPSLANQQVWLEEFFCEEDGKIWMYLSKSGEGVLSYQLAEQEQWRHTARVSEPDNLCQLERFCQVLPFDRQLSSEASERNTVNSRVKRIERRRAERRQSSPLERWIFGVQKYWTEREALLSEVKKYQYINKHTGQKVNASEVLEESLERITHLFGTSSLSSLSNPSVLEVLSEYVSHTYQVSTHDRRLKDSLKTRHG